MKSSWVASIMALALLAGSLPRFARIIVQDHEAALTLDICDPLQPVDNPSGSSVGMALIPPPPAASALVEVGALPEPVLAAESESDDAPDPPPPKTLA